MRKNNATVFSIGFRMCSNWYPFSNLTFKLTHEANMETLKDPRRTFVYSTIFMFNFLVFSVV